MTKSTSAPGAALVRRRLAAVPMLAGLGVLLGTWALLPRYGGPRLELGPRGDQLEFLDHVVPGTVVIVVSLLALLIGRRASTLGPLFGVGLVIVVAGLWMDATHLPLVLQATRSEAPWGATLYHSTPGLAVLLLGVGWCLLFRADAAAPSRAGARS